MAGGLAQRMIPYSYYTEKSLLPLAGGRPIVRIIVERIRQYLGQVPPSNFIFCISEKYRDHFEWEFRNEGHNFSAKIEAIGTATHYYYAAEKEFHFVPNETVLIHYADALTELNYAHFLKVFEESGKNAMIAVTKNAKHEYSEVIIQTPFDDSEQRYATPPKQAILVEKFHEKANLTAPTWIGIVLLKHRVMQEEFGNSLFGKKADFGYDVFPRLAEKEKLYAYLYNGMWEDLGNVKSYSKAVEKYRGFHSFDV
jgi:NDP-sugar pyrophosphorylase family protein